MKKNGALQLVFILLISILFLCCSKKQDNAGTKTFRYSESIMVDGLSRSYTLNLPPNYYETDGFSLVIAMHGGGGDAAQFETSSKLTEKANASNFIVVYPNGVKSTGILAAQTWNAGNCCDFASDNHIDDVKFISQLIDKLLASYKINPKKVYATGHSNGGMMAYRLACEISNKIAAIAPNSCTMVVTQPCNPSRAVPVLHMHSVLDTRVPYLGGKGTGFANIYFPPVDSVLNVWSLVDGCSITAQVITNNSGYKLMKWSGCRDNTGIQFYLTKDGGHAWPGGSAGSASGDTPSTAINADDLLWQFFQQYQLP